MGMDGDASPTRPGRRSAPSRVQHATRKEIGERVMGLFPLTNGLAMVNTAPIGVIGQLVGLRMVMPALGWTTLVLVLAIIVAMPAIRLVPAQRRSTGGHSRSRPLAHGCSRNILRPPQAPLNQFGGR